MGSWRRATALTAAFLAGALLYGQRGFRGFDEDYDPPQLPADHDERTEFYFARLKYDSARGGWRYSSWATDYPKADRQFLQGVRRLTRIHSRSVEEVIDINTDSIYNYPWVYAVEVGHWSFTDKQAARMRDYLNRGGFLMVDDFHGTLEWQVFAEGIQKVLPNRPIVNLEDGEPVFHLLYEIDKRVQVPGIHVIRSGRTYERDGYEPRWRGIYDDKGRLLVAICHNMDLGDAWEWADHPAYPENMASVAYRIALNYILYSMTH